MLRSRTDIPFDRDGSVRFLPWLIALMVYLASLALAGMLVLNGAIGQWDRSLAGTLTIELPPAADGKDSNADVTLLLANLRRLSGVQAADLLSRDAIAKLVEPWLGGGVAAQELALPRLIDLRVDPDNPPDLKTLRAIVAGVPGATLDDSQQWLGRVFDLTISIELTAFLIVLMIGGAAILSVIFTTRAGLAVHRNVIEILHLLGAQDRYIAAQFGRQALSLGLQGGVIGLALAVLTLFGIGHSGAAAPLLDEPSRLFPTLELAPWHWSVLALLPLSAAFIARLTARLTVMRTLARMP